MAHTSSDRDLVPVQLVCKLISAITHRVNNDYMAIATHSQVIGMSGSAEIEASVREILQTCETGSQWLTTLTATVRNNPTAVMEKLKADRPI